MHGSLIRGAAKTRTANDDGDFWSDIALVALRANLHICEPTWRLEPRVLPNHQVWLIVSGSGRLAVAGTEHSLRSGAVALIPQAVPHWAEHDPRSPLHCHVLHFEARVLGAQAPGALAALPSLLSPEPEIMQELVAAASVMSREVGYRSPDHVLLANAAITRLFGLLWSVDAALRRSGHVSTVLPGHTRLAPVLTYIADHFSNPITLAELALVVGVSPTHLCHLFRNAVGLSPFQYLQRYRMRRARDLLETTDLVVADIGRRVGFSDPAYFSRAFRRLEGMTPSQYRELRSTVA
ncbi:helix-turn-helix transcriptional regulator [Actinopolymorpha alba]|uniref:helix-turn-helix transcriptional regulator n=1 Tax=Actinopolymorpha alba TaxID=533267 RepID=UPI0003711D62|nr:AraC family transcriptional regulator [Actinopolymorpha alba]